MSIRMAIACCIFSFLTGILGCIGIGLALQHGHASTGDIVWWGTGGSVCGLSLFIAFGPLCALLHRRLFPEEAATIINAASVQGHASTSIVIHPSLPLTNTQAATATTTAIPITESTALLDANHTDDSDDYYGSPPQRL